MPAPARRVEGLSLTVRRPRAGLIVARMAGERPLMRAIPEHFATAMHFGGRSRWTCGGSDWESGPGDVSVKVPGEAMIERAREGGLASQVVLFDSAVFEEARTTLGRPVLMPHSSSFEGRDPRIRPLAALHHALLEDVPGEDLEEAMCEALHALVDVVSTPPSAPSPRSRFSVAVVRARAFLDERLTETVTLEDLAAHARLDKFRLCRAFREQVGLPPHTYVVHRRIARAQSLLARGMPQAEVAARVGFYDQSLLHRHFKQIVRLTPGAWARAARS